MEQLQNSIPRKNFIGTLLTGATALGLASLSSCDNKEKAAIPVVAEKPDPHDEWFSKLQGKTHKVVYDAIEPKEIFPFAWPRVFLMSNEQTGSKANDCGVVVVLRHNAIPYAMGDQLWEKYNFGDFFKADDPHTKKPATRNPFWQPKADDFKIPVLDTELKIGINQLQDEGVMFCVCGMAIHVLSAIIAGSMKLNPADVEKEWIAGILPGIQLVPSGVWALGRAQEHGCGYIKV